MLLQILLGLVVAHGVLWFVASRVRREGAWRHRYQVIGFFLLATLLGALVWLPWRATFVVWVVVNGAFFLWSRRHYPPPPARGD